MTMGYPSRYQNCKKSIKKELVLSGLVGKRLKGVDDSSAHSVAISDQMSWGQDVDQREGQVHKEHIEPDTLIKTVASSWVHMHFYQSLCTFCQWIAVPHPHS